jgi:hypothetical protein
MLHPVTAQAFIAHALTVMRSVTDAANSVAHEIMPFITENAPDTLGAFERALNGTDAAELSEVHDLLGEPGVTEDSLHMAMLTAHNLVSNYALLAVTFGLPGPTNVDEVREATERMAIIARSL